MQNALVRIQYKKIRNQVRKLTKNFTIEYESEIAKNGKENSKAIQRYINAQAKNKESIIIY